MSWLGVKAILETPTHASLTKEGQTPPTPNDWEVTKSPVLRGTRPASTLGVSVLVAEGLRHQRQGPELEESPRSLFPGVACRPPAGSRWPGELLQRADSWAHPQTPPAHPWWGGSGEAASLTSPPGGSEAPPAPAPREEEKGKAGRKHRLPRQREAGLNPDSSARTTWGKGPGPSKSRSAGL